MKTAPKNILVTGANGYIGTSLIYRLREAGYRIKAIVGQNSDGVCLPNIHTMRRGVDDDARLARALVESDTMVYLAGVKGYNQCAQELNKVIDANILFLQQLLSLNQNNSLKIIFASTYWVYGHKAPLPYHEDMTIMPSEVYGWSKALGEQLIRTSGLPYTIVRLTNVFGYGRGRRFEEVTSLFLKRAFRGETITLKNQGAHCLDLVSIDDVGEVFEKIIKKGSDNNTINVGSGRPVTIYQLAEQVNHISEKLTSQRGKIELGHPEDDAISFADRWVSIEKLQKYIEFVPTPLSISLEQFAQELLATRTA
ncbi:MAG: NAD(P)-dependent oxidoreductase [Syntrophobacterales bacterium]|jgi:nucleoside-diphosphate-sugar epimerase|nr:NAD(P)-dependent oxidoreductase [Syntrophobacterales bacterium]